MALTALASGRSGRLATRLHLLTRVVIWITVLATAVVVTRAHVDEPLRRYLERRVNAALDGYTVSIGKLGLHLIGFGVDLQEVTVLQNTRPRPPMAYIPSWNTRVDWRALLDFAVVADTSFDRPQVFLTEDQTVEEAEDPRPLSDKGWQDAITAVYPLKVNTLRVREGTVEYHHGGEGPIRLEHIDFETTNIRNVRSVPGYHPSPIRLDCTVFESGGLIAWGSADFFAKPSPAVVADFSLRDAPLERLAPMARQSAIFIKGGTLATDGQLAEEPGGTQVTLRSVVVSKPVLEYARGPETRDREDVRVAKDSTANVSVWVDELRVKDGSLTYRTPSPSLLPPINLERTTLRLTSLGGPPAPRGVLPSQVELDAALLGTGSLRVRGRADLAATKGPLGDVAFDVQRIELSRFDQMTRPKGLTIADGILGTAGRLTRDPEQTTLVVHRLGVVKPVVEFVQVTPKDEQRVETAAKGTTEARERPAVRVDLERAEVTDGTFGFTNERATNPYRLFLANTDVTLAGFSNERAKRDGVASIRGRFMDSGPAALDARFAQGGAGAPDFQLGVQVENVQLTTLNDLLRGTGGFDVVDGRFSFYSEFTVRNGRVDGYVKPFFSDMNVYDLKQDAAKDVGQQLYEALVGGGATVLQNFREAVATKAELSGPVENPEASTWQMVIGLLRNAFWRALVPGVDPRRNADGDRR
jgi:hypothetical protein